MSRPASLWHCGQSFPTRHLGVFVTGGGRSFAPNIAFHTKATKAIRPQAINVIATHIKYSMQFPPVDLSYPATFTERRPLPGIADSLPQWLYRGKSPRPPGKTLEETVRRLRFPEGHIYVWMALESGAMRRIRRYLMDDAGLPPEQIITRSYWKLGAADHPDSDYGDP